MYHFDSLTSVNPNYAMNSSQTQQHNQNQSHRFHSDPDQTTTTFDPSHFPLVHHHSNLQRESSNQRGHIDLDYLSKLCPRSLSALPNPVQYYLNLFYEKRVKVRRTQIAKTLREIVQIAQELLHEVELQEPRFISTLKLVQPNSQSGSADHNFPTCKQMTHGFDMGDHGDLNQIIVDDDDDCKGDIINNNSDRMIQLNSKTIQTKGVSNRNGNPDSTTKRTCYYDSLRVLSSTHFEITLFLNQMGVFNFVDDSNIPGGAILKLSDGRKRSMSLWVEFITASGYLSARKIRTRFHSLINQAIQKSSYRAILKMFHNTTEVRICIRDRYVLTITPGFRCTGLWPRSANHWPVNNFRQNPIQSMGNLGQIQWPAMDLVNEVKREGFCLLSQEFGHTSKDNKQQASVEGDAWLLDFYDAEEKLLNGAKRRQCYSILKTLIDEHLTGKLGSSTSGQSNQLRNPIIKEYDIKTLVLHECEKHPLDEEWTEQSIGDRLNSILLQLISCLQHRRCPHYFLPQLDIFRGNSPVEMDIVAKQAWCLLRELLTCPQALEHL